MFETLKQSHRSSSQGRTLLIISTGYDIETKEYAVLVDPLPRYSVYKTRYGMPTECKLDIEHIYVRESWNCHEDKQAVYLDWQALDK